MGACPIGALTSAPADLPPEGASPSIPVTRKGADVGGQHDSRRRNRAARGRWGRARSERLLPHPLTCRLKAHPRQSRSPGREPTLADSMILAGAIELLGADGGVPSAIPSCAGAIFRLGAGYDGGTPQPVVDILGQMALDGERPFGRRTSNRTVKLPRSEEHTS